MLLLFQDRTATGQSTPSKPAYLLHRCSTLKGYSAVQMLEIARGALMERFKPPGTNKATEHQDTGFQQI